METTSYTKTIYKLLLLVLVIIDKNTVVLSFRQYLSSPCPSIFQYQFDNSGTLYGAIRIDSPQVRRIQLDVELSVGNSVQGYNGNIYLLHDKQRVINDVMNSRPIDYKVYFPAWKGIPPKITKIEVNGNLICSGSKIPIRLVPILTTIKLQHILTIDVTNLLASPEPAVDNLPDATDLSNSFDVREFDLEIPIEIDRPNHGNNLKRENNPFLANNFNPQPRRPPPPPPDDYRPPPPPDGNRAPPPPDGNRAPPPPDGNRPPPPPPDDDRPTRIGGTSNTINFQPSIPKDPSKIYNGNPFFNAQSASTPRSNIQETQNQNAANNQLFNVRVSSESPPVVAHANVPRRGSNSDSELPVNLAQNGPTSLSKQPYGDVCGQSFATTSLILEGNNVPVGAYPWLAALFKVEPATLSYKCGGSLISNRHVVTAAHCVNIDNKKLKPQDLLIILGKLNIQRWSAGNGEKMIEPESIHIHKDYNYVKSDADIAVLVLSETVEFTKYIRPLCLWDGNSDVSLVVGQKGTVVGWGRDEHENLMTAEPKQIEIPIFSQEYCLRSDPRFHFITSNRTFCAGSENGSGPCNGDSGSAFIMKRNGRYMLRGIVSVATSQENRRTCDLSKLVVFTDASKFLDWLISFIK